MQISGRATLGGIPILEVRKVFRDHLAWHADSLYLNRVKDTLNMNDRQVKKFLRALIEQGLITEARMTSRQAFHEQEFPITEKGQNFARASAAKRIKRETAKAVVEGFMKRVEEVNQDRLGFSFKVQTVIVYGSFLRNNETLGDVDIAVELVPRFGELGSSEQKAADKKRTAGRNFQRFMDALYWPETEVKRFLKNRKRSISLHDMHSFIHMEKQNDFSYTVLLGDEERVKAMLEKAPLT